MLSHGLFFTVLGYEHFWYFLAESLAAEEGASLSQMERSVLFFAVAVAAVPVFLILATVSQKMLLLLLLLLLLFILVTFLYCCCCWLLLLLLVAMVVVVVVLLMIMRAMTTAPFLQLQLSYFSFFESILHYTTTIIFPGHCVRPRFPPAQGTLLHPRPGGEPEAGEQGQGEEVRNTNHSKFLICLQLFICLKTFLGSPSPPFPGRGMILENFKKYPSNLNKLLFDSNFKFRHTFNSK